MSAMINSFRTVPVRESLRFDEGALEDWMRDNIADFGGPINVEQFPGGQSNPTFKLTTPDHDYVIRRKPPGQLLKGAHAVHREARVLMALENVGFPVPHVHALCADDSVIGSWFYVMDMVRGRIFWDASFPEIGCHDRPAYFDTMNETIAALHRVDFTAVGLGDFGKIGNYLERQIGRWKKQYLEDANAGRDINLDRLIEWLEANIPAGDEVSIVHGDFRCDNMIFDPVRPVVVAVLDWELSTLGDPLADFAYHTMMYRMPTSIVAGLGGMDPAVINAPSEAEYIDAYCRRTGRDEIPYFDFYMAFSFFRLAAILHGIKGRVLRGTACSAQAQERVRFLPELAALAWQQV